MGILINANTIFIQKMLFIKSKNVRFLVFKKTILRLLSFQFIQIIMRCL
jgi:hypothetical protein